MIWANDLTLQDRLELIYRGVPRPLADHLPPVAQLVKEVKHTRNWLTHFSRKKASVLTGFELLDTTEHLRIVLQYLLLRELGFERADATRMARRSFTRSLYRGGVTESIGTA